MRREATVLLLIVTTLVLLGSLTVYSVNAVKHGNEDTFHRHLILMGLGVLCMIAAARFDYHWFKSRILFGGLTLTVVALLILVLIIGEEIRGARRWIFGFQPSELAKIAVIIFLSIKLTENQTHIKTFFRGFLPPYMIALTFAGLITLEPDLGVPFVLVCTAYLMMYVAGVRGRHLATGLVPVGVGLVVLIIAYPYRMQRLLAFLDPWKYPLTEGFHLIQSLAGFKRGAMTGVGPGAGEQKLLYLPDADTDFIFSVVGEEMGFVGTLGVAVLFALFLIVAIRITLCARDRFGALLATGITSLIVSQAAFNMAVTIGLVPTKGLPLPFVSRGGTASIVFLTLVGMLLNIALQAEERDRRY